MITSKKYTGNKRCQDILAAGVAVVPNISLNQVPIIMACARRSLLMEIGIDVTEEQCASSSPKANVISSSLGRLAGSCLLQKLKIL